MYVPQFAFPLAPDPCEDLRFTYSYDSTNLPTFIGTLAPGQQTGRIPLRLDKDADFYLRAISLGGRAAVRLEDPKDNALSDSDNPLQVQNFVNTNQFGNSAGAGVTALESGAGGIYAPAGGNFIVFLANLTNATINLSDCVVNLHGVKRYPGGGCA